MVEAGRAKAGPSGAAPGGMPGLPAVPWSSPAGRRPWRLWPTRATLHRLWSESTSVGAWRSLVARIVRDDEVGGSNPLAPTNPSRCRIATRTRAPDAAPSPVSSLTSTRTRAPPWCPQRSAAARSGPRTSSPAALTCHLSGPGQEPGATVVHPRPAPRSPRPLADRGACDAPASQVTTTSVASVFAAPLLSGR
jgi:hypothetical protein